MKLNCATPQSSNQYHHNLSNIVLRYLIVILLGLFLLTIGGCQLDKQTDDQTVHITLWHGIDPRPNRDIFQKLVDRFNQAHPELQVESIYAGKLDQQIPKVLTAVVGNVPPDILFFNPQITGQLIGLRAIRPIEDWLDKSPLKSEIIPNCFGEMQLGGHIWSVPLFAGNVGLFYRRDLFRAAGITQLPKTWAQLRQVAKQLTLLRNGDKRPEQYGMLMPFGKGEWTVFNWFPFLFSSDGTVVENNRPNLLNPSAIAALQFWQDLIKDGSTKFSAPERGYEGDDFIAGRVAMQLTMPGTSIMRSKVDYGVLPVPRNRHPATVLGGGNMFVMKTTPEREQAALKFLEYVISEEFQTKWSIDSSSVPINQKSFQSQAYQQFIKLNPVMKVFLDQMSVAGSRPIIPGYNRLSESLGRAIEATMLGASPNTSLKEAQAHLDLFWH